MLGALASEDSGFVVGGSVDFIEIATAQERQIDGSKIAWRLHDEGCGGEMSGVIDGGMLDLNLPRIGAESGQVRSNCDMGYAGNCMEARQKLIVETLPGVGIFI